MVRHYGVVSMIPVIDTIKKQPTIKNGSVIFSQLKTDNEMKEYLFLFRGGDRPSMDPSAAEAQAAMQKWMQWMGGLAAQGKLGPSQPLHPTGTQVKGTGKVVTDGPFMEGKEMVGGYLLCKADSYEEATELAKGCPILNDESGIVEVREVRELKM